jgi:hypothetical protein
MTPREKLARSFRAELLKHVERVRVEDVPAEGTFTIVDNGTSLRMGDRYVQARYKGAQWVRPGGTRFPLSRRSGCLSSRAGRTKLEPASR